MGIFESTTRKVENSNTESSNTESSPEYKPLICDRSYYEYAFLNKHMPLILDLEKTILPIEVRATILNIPLDTYQYCVESIDIIRMIRVGRNNIISSIILGWPIEKCRHVRNKNISKGNRLGVLAFVGYVVVQNDYTVFNEFIDNFDETKPNPMTTPLFYKWDKRIEDATFIDSRRKAYMDTLCVAVKWAETKEEHSSLSTSERTESIGITLGLYEYILDSVEYKNIL